MINMLVTLHIKPGLGAKVEELLRELETETTENDKGCLRYQWYRAEKPDTYYLLERWIDQEAIEAHARATHMARLLPQVSECAAETMAVVRLARLE